MHHPASTTETFSPTVPRTAWALPAAGLLVLAHLAWILAHFAPAIMSPDANGYVVQARLIATAGKTSLTTESPAQFVGMHWLETDGGVFYSRYPAGLPVMFAAAWKLGGLRAALLVNPLLASATVLLTFLLARRLTDDRSALLAAAVVAINATAQQHALDADAHTAAAFFLTAGVLTLLKFADDPKPLRGLVAGLLLGIVPTVRYPEAIAGVAIGAWLLWRVRPIARLWPAVLGAALPIGALCVHNAAAYGAFWRTGYALTGEQTGFGWNYFTAHALSYLESLGGAGLGVFFAFGAAGLAGLVADPRRRETGALLAGIVVPLVLLYMAYYFGAGEGNLRFLVPTFPFFAAAGAWLLGQVAEKLGAAGRAAWIAIAALQLVVAGAATAQVAVRERTSLSAAARVRTTLESAAPAGSVVIVERQLAESLDAAGQWRLVEESLIGGGGVGAGAGPMGARRGAGRGGAGGPPATAGQPSPQQANKNRAQHARYDGVSAAEKQTRAWSDLRAWAASRPVFWLTRSIDTLDELLPAGADYESIAEVDAPGMTMMGGPGGGGMRGGGGPGGPPMGGNFGPDGGMRPPDGAMGGSPMMGGLGRGGANFAGRPGAPNGGAAENQKLRLVKITFAKN
jgi:hypothetical protein